MTTDDRKIKEQVTQRVHKLADKADWRHLNIAQRQQLYEQWSTDSEIGGLLRKVIKPERVRVYLKDTVMKNYSRDKRPAIRDLLASMSISYEKLTKQYIKPQGVLCDGTSLYTLTVAKEWKVALMSAFERERELRRVHHNVVFITEHTTGRFVDKPYREIIEDAARRLGIEVRWID